MKKTIKVLLFLLLGLVVLLALLPKKANGEILKINQIINKEEIKNI